MKSFFKQITRAELIKVLDDFQSQNKIILSNFFGLSDGLNYDLMQGEGTLILRVAEFDYHRIFVLCANTTGLLDLLKSLDTEYVINIPSKKGIDNWCGLLENGGFEHYATYSHYLNLAVPGMKKRQTSTGEFAKINELQQIYDLLYRSFTTYASHLPSKEELSEMILNNRMFVDHDDKGYVCGVNIFTITGTNAYGNAWVDEGERGLDIFIDMFNLFIDKGVKRFVFWVKDGNNKVIKMHKIMGAKPDGLKDYTYIKNKKNK